MTIAFLNDADLHGLVDGHLDPAKRTDLLKRLALAPDDRVRVEAWQHQTDLLRSAFVGVDREPLPANLDLNPKTRLRCISMMDEPIPSIARRRPSADTRRSVFTWVRASCFLAIALGAVVWLGIAYGKAPNRTGSIVPKGPVIDVLRHRAAAIVTDPSPGISLLPTVVIPNLESAGFRLVGVDADKEPASLQMRYRNDVSDRIVISVARAVAAPVVRPERLGNAYVWRTGANTFAMTGTIDPERLRIIALALQADDIQ